MGVLQPPRRRQADGLPKPRQVGSGGSGPAYPARLPMLGALHAWEAAENAAITLPQSLLDE
jgi:hypothetical protein